MKRYPYPKKLLQGNAGFTLLEVICVVAIMGLLAAMVVPASVRMQRAAKISATQARLDEIKAAIVGNLGVYDTQGNPVAGGFAGDTGRLPYLFSASWNEEKGQWDWVYEEEGAFKTVNNGTGQPAELWREIPPDYASSEWAGPYLPAPRDPYPDDTKNITYAGDPEIFTKKQVVGRLSDAWGRALNFWREFPLLPNPEGEGFVRDVANETGAVLWLISAGPDGNAVFAGEEYDAAAAENKDNIIVKIMPREWYWENSDLKTAGTRKILSKVRNAVVAGESSTLLSGYIGDMGAWPQLYAWNKTTGAWEPAAAGLVGPEDPLYTEEYDTHVTTGSPRGLWVKIHGNADADLWNGPYLDAPWGANEKELLEDDWGKPLRFRLVTATSGEEIPVVVAEYLEITSGGMDMTMGTADDITVILHDHQWKKDGRDKNTLVKKAQVQTLLDAVRAAFLGNGSARDAAGRTIAGGYLADTGSLPGIETNTQTGIRETTAPLWLWENPYTSENPPPTGFSWRGPYYPETENGEIDDPWGNPLHFVIDEDAVLHIISAGPDRRTGMEDGINCDEDNVSRTIAPDDWSARNFTIKGTLVNPAPWTAVTTIAGEPDPDDPENTITVVHEPNLNGLPSCAVTFELYARPGDEPLFWDTGTISALDGKKDFSLNVSHCVGGERLLIIRQDGVEIASISLYIGPGGTQSPTAHRLSVYLEPLS
jgi:prepilin-type N-terminal cleavage/methylation domain-containing protein